MSNQREKACAATRAIIAAPRSTDALRALYDVLGEAQNPPPDGAADGSISPDAWNEVRRLHDAMANAQSLFNRAAELLREPRPAPF